MNRVEEAFKQNELVPQLLPVAPKETLQVAYGIYQVNLGEELTPTQVQNEPQVSWISDPNALYTLIMADPDAPSRKHPHVPEGMHWLVTNIPGHNVHQGQILINYFGAGPPPYTGLHRYIFLLYKQNGKIFDEELGRIGKGIRGRHQSIVAFTKKHQLGDPVAGNFFQAKFDAYVLKAMCYLLCCCCCR